MPTERSRITNDIHGTLHQVELALEVAEQRAEQAEALLERIGGAADELAEAVEDLNPSDPATFPALEKVLAAYRTASEGGSG